MSTAPMPVLDLHGDVVALTRALCDIESVSGNETRIADVVEAALRQLSHLEVLRDGDAVMARTADAGGERVVIAGHLDTVPLAARPSGGMNVPTWIEGDDVWGRGTVDMKAGVAVQLSAAAQLSSPNRGITWILYDHEEVEASKNGLGRLARNHPEWLQGDFAVLGEPSNGGVEGGCNGTMRVEVELVGETAHSARAWLGDNAVHKAADVLQRLREYTPRDHVEVDGLVYRESLNAVLISGGHATNSIPDRCTVTVNYRFAPSRSVAQAQEHLQEVFEGFPVRVVDAAPGARPGLDHPAASAFVAAIGKEPTPKYGWTDVARFSEMGIPAVNFGPGDPLLAHRDDEHCPVQQIRDTRAALIEWLS